MQTSALAASGRVFPWVVFPIPVLGLFLTISEWRICCIELHKPEEINVRLSVWEYLTIWAVAIALIALWCCLWWCSLLMSIQTYWAMWSGVPPSWMPQRRYRVVIFLRVFIRAHIDCATYVGLKFRPFLHIVAWNLWAWLCIHPVLDHLSAHLLYSFVLS